MPRGRTRSGRARAGDEDATRAMTLLGTPRCSKSREAARGRAEGRARARRSRSRVAAKVGWMLALATFGSRGTDAMEEGRIAAGGAHTCVIADDGEVWCWGRNNQGQLGLGDTTQRISPAGPVDFGSGRKAKYIAAGWYHTCAILDDADDSLMCWGSNNHEDFGNVGQLGIGSSAVSHETSPAGPINVGNGRHAKSLALGFSKTCALLDDGSVKCWGWNGVGELGVGDLTDLNSPGNQVTFGMGSKAKYIAASYSHACAILEDDDSLMCWGSNGSGQLGILTAGGSFSTPISTEDLGSGRTAVNLALGSGHTCAILDNRDVKCWGNYDLTYPPAEALDLGTGIGAIAISSTGSVTCALLDDATIRCWGNNFTGQLGVGDTASRTGVAPAVTFTGNLNATSVVVGGNHVCASASDGSLWCWGFNGYGQLGDGSTTTAWSPVLLPNVTVSFSSPPPPALASQPPSAIADADQTPSSPGPADDPDDIFPENTTASPPPVLSSVAEPPPPPRVLVADDESGARVSTRRAGRSAVLAIVVGAAASMVTVGSVAGGDERVSRRG